VTRFVLVLLVALATGGFANPIEIVTRPVSSFAPLGASLGPLEWRGGLSITSIEKKFGGLSGIVLTPDCTGLLAVSDAGFWFRARLEYEAGLVENLTAAEFSPILDDKGKPLRSKPRADAEAIADLGGGSMLVGFESRTRAGIYDIGGSGLSARFEPIRIPKEIRMGPDNAELEAIGRFAGGPLRGDFIAISEFNIDEQGNIRGWTWNHDRSAAFAIKRHEDYKITDLALLPDGGVLTLERSYGTSLLPGMALRRFDSSAIRDGGTVEPEVVFSGRAPFYAIDNMEGIAVCRFDGETRLTIISDNNFSARQRTLLLQFSYEP
jgi:hypothetical protein